MAYLIFVLLILVLPLLMIGAGVLTIRAFNLAAPDIRRVGRRYTLLVIGFILLDFLLLKALPWLGLSYGPVAVTLFGDIYLRALLYVPWGGLLLRSGRSRISFSAAAPFWAFNIVLTLLLVYGFYVEPFNLRVTHIQVPVDREKLSKPVRIVHLSDIHVERTTLRERALIPVVEAQKPDLILLTGDYLNLSYLEDPVAMRDARDVLAQFHAPLGIYAVNGSVDNVERMQALFAGLNVTVLEDRTAQVQTPGGTIDLMGVYNRETFQDEREVSRLASGLIERNYRILLYHTPDLINSAARNGVDLYLAGHTHGGQVRLPVYGAIITASDLGKQYEMGRYQLENTTLYVSRGIGMEGSLAPRARFLAPPEVVVIDLFPTP